MVWSGADLPTRQPRLAAPVPLRSYQVTYAVTFSGGVHNIEQITVQRPGNGMDVTYRGGRVVAGELTNSTGLWDWSTNGAPGWMQIAQGAERAVSDAQPVAALNVGIGQASVAVIGTSRVAGRPCTVVVTGEPAGQPLQPPDKSTQTTICVDRTGVPLSERWMLNGKLGEQMTATSFIPDFAVTASTFDAQPRPPGPPSTPPVQSVPLTASSRSHMSPILDPPSGYALSAGYVSVEQDSQTGLPSFTTKELYENARTGGLLELDYLGTPAGTSGIPETLPGGRRAYLTLDFYSCTLAMTVNGGASIVIAAPDPNLLLQAAAHLHF